MASLRQPGIFGQMCWDTYTLIILGFRDQQGSSREQVLATLDSSARRLLNAFPFLAGQVVKRGQTSTNSGTYEIVPYPPHEEKSPVRRKDCTGLCPSYDEILNADAPFSMLDGDVLCPMKGMGFAYDHSSELPVLIVQANFVKGGLLLCFASMHNALDMNGQGTVLKLFAAAGRGDEFDPAIVAAGNSDADKIVPLLKPGETQLAHETMRRPSTLNASGPPPGSLPPMSWAYWRLPKDKLAELKKTASSGSTWVSTNDAITALFVRRLTAARVAAERVNVDEDVHLQRAVDSRSILKPPVLEGYMGHLVAVAETEWQSAKEVYDPELADTAVKIRESLKEVDDHFVRSLATLISKTEDKTTIFYGVKNKPGRDFLVSSWAQLHWLHQCDFGPGLGTVDFVRRARLPEVPDLTYIMPKNAKGDMHVAVCLFNKDLESLAKDKVWIEYAEHVG
jgi:trichothecene 3-O-acetyltransferase